MTAPTLWTPVVSSLRALPEAVGRRVLGAIDEFGAMAIFLGRSLLAGTRRPWRLRLLLEQAEFIGFGSLFIILLTGVFTGAVFTLQSVDALARVGMESMVGSTVLLATSRELGPVLSALMVSGRVGSAMATELGTMRVSEQIDAIEVMAIDPYNYLIAPRIFASAIMVPCLCILFDLIASIGAYLVAVVLMHIDEGAYRARIAWYLDPSDFTNGMIKALVFGTVIATIGCYKGFHAKGGARGVGQATTQTVVLASICVFMLDYVMTAMMLHHAGH
jgi:phospholipid/cholesterol/gamma-HCH transport system permease protein